MKLSDLNLAREDLGALGKKNTDVLTAFCLSYASFSFQDVPYFFLEKLKMCNICLIAVKQGTVVLSSANADHRI